jgi:hypothetical protein
MTNRKIVLALKKIEVSYADGYVIEALIANYHLNLNLLRFICSVSEGINPKEEKKIKNIVTQLAKEIDTNQKLKTVISKKNLKFFKVWLSKTEVYFKTLKYKLPVNTKSLFLETQKITGILNISVNKIIAANK